MLVDFAGDLSSLTHHSSHSVSVLNLHAVELADSGNYSCQPAGLHKEPARRSCCKESRIAQAVLYDAVLCSRALLWRCLTGPAGIHHTPCPQSGEGAKTVDQRNFCGRADLAGNLAARSCSSSLHNRNRTLTLTTKFRWNYLC